MKIVKQSVEVLTFTPDAAKLIEAAGRTCYKSEGKINPESARRFVCMLLERGHLSVLEHASATLRIVCDRGVSHELVRHRLASFSQESTRYCRYGGDIAFIEPPGLDDDSRYVWERSILIAEGAYKHLLELGQRPEIARSVLPNALKTEVVITANFREWLHILGLREAPAAHTQMREVMGIARQALCLICPEVFGAPKEAC